MKLRDEPCSQCGWKFPGFHVCVDLTKSCAGEGQARINATAARYKLEHARNADRNQKIVSGYNQGYSLSQLSEQFSLPKHTVRRIVKRAEDAGEATIRPKGGNARMMEVHDGI